MKTVLITGANRGLGSSLATTFGSGGWRLILQCRTRDISVGGCAGATIVRGDIREDPTIAKLEKIAEDSDLNVLINNASIYLNKSVSEMNTQELREVIDTNLMAPMILTMAIWKVFQSKGSGLIININSIAGKQGGAGESAYCASKHGLRGFSNAIQFDGTKDNIRVISFNFGAMNTDMASWRKGSDKFISPDEAADLIYKVCCDYQTLRISEIDVGRRIY